MAAAHAAGRAAGRRPAPSEVDSYVATARAWGLSWQKIADGLNRRMAAGGPPPPQGADRWVRSSVRDIHRRVLREREPVQLELPLPMA